MIIYHITPRMDWESAREPGEYRALSLVSEGFIHASTAEQVVDTANRYYRGKEDLVLLAIDTERVKPEVKFENAHVPTGAQDFPHIYGPLNIDAVVEVIELPVGEDGAFTTPPELTPRF